MAKRGPKTPKHINRYAENLVAEIFDAIRECISDHATDGQVIKAQEKVKEILVRETHDVAW